MIGLEIVGVVLLLIVGSAMLIGNKLMEKAVHEDMAEAEAYVAERNAKNRRTSA